MKRLSLEMDLLHVRQLLQRTTTQDMFQGTHPFSYIHNIVTSHMQIQDSQNACLQI